MNFFLPLVDGGGGGARAQQHTQYEETDFHLLRVDECTRVCCLPFTKTVSPTGALRLRPTDRGANGGGDWKAYVSSRSRCSRRCFKAFLVVTLAGGEPMRLLVPPLLSLLVFFDGRPRV